MPLASGDDEGRTSASAAAGSGAHSATNAAAPPSFADPKIAALAAEAGSDAAVGRGRALAVGMIVIGIVGAVGSAMRPILRRSLQTAANKPTRTAAEALRAGTQAAGSGAAVDVAAIDAHGCMAYANKRGERVVLSLQDTQEVQRLLERMRQLQQAHQARHPLWYGMTTPEIEDMVKDARVQAALGAEPPPPPPFADAATAALLQQDATNGSDSSSAQLR